MSVAELIDLLGSTAEKELEVYLEVDGQLRKIRWRRQEDQADGSEILILYS